VLLTIGTGLGGGNISRGVLQQSTLHSVKLLYAGGSCGPPPGPSD
jgi:hypothetical protein